MSKRNRQQTSFIYVTERDRRGNSIKKNTILFSDDEIYEIDSVDDPVAAYVITEKRKFYINEEDYQEYLRIAS